MDFADTPVTAPADFFGQRGIIKRIFSRIGAERPQSVAVIGSIKSGKTSLVNYVMNETVRSQYLDELDKYYFCQINIREEAFTSIKDFIDKVIKCLFNEKNGEENPYTGLQKKVEALHSGGKILVLLLDDFHLITSSESFPLEFFSFLRSLANNYNVAYVTTSFLELQKLCVVKDIEESPFFNIFTNLSLGLISKSAAEKILEPAFNPEVGKSLVEWLGPSPYLLKLVGNEILERKIDKGKIIEKNYESLFLPLISPYFEQIISILDNESYKPLKNLGAGKAPAEKELHLLRPLVRYGFLEEYEDTLQSFSPAFTLFLKSKLSNKMLKGVFSE
ncbi:MAG: ATP-binding protein [Spirochaetales bacterium]|nr:ATP-binding protein [Spirochaetales bacterium]